MNKQNKKDDKGSFSVILLILVIIIIGLAIIAIGAALCFGWIVGAIWLLFFSKKSNMEPKKQELTTATVLTLSIISFVLMVTYLISSSSTEEGKSNTSYVAEITTKQKNQSKDATTKKSTEKQTTTKQIPQKQTTTPAPTTTQAPTTTPAPTTTQAPTTIEISTEPLTQPPTEPPIEEVSVINNTSSYVLNTSTHKIHSPSCRYVKEIAQKNYSTWSGESVDDFLASNPEYSRCKKCNPR